MYGGVSIMVCLAVCGSDVLYQVDGILRNKESLQILPSTWPSINNQKFQLNNDPKHKLILEFVNNP